MYIYLFIHLYMYLYVFFCSSCSSSSSLLSVFFLIIANYIVYYYCIITPFLLPAGCHPSCDSCSGAGPLSCTTCPAGSVLLPSGLCASRCPLGYYDDGGRICQRKAPPHISLVSL